MSRSGAGKTLDDLVNSVTNIVYITQYRSTVKLEIMIFSASLAKDITPKSYFCGIVVVDKVPFSMER